LSRLVIDCNRPLDAPDLVPAISEATVVPGNAGLSAVEREQRIALSWRPFHAALEAVIAERIARRQETRLVSIHSFTPVYHGRSRPWQIGIIHDEDRRLAGPLIEALQRMEELRVGVNEPYSPADRVYFTHERHARPRGLACAMIEIRNDEIADEDGQRRWADLLGGILSRIRPAAADEPLPARSRRV
jgi:predicted N-formylglutamate amidohydrolase